MNEEELEAADSWNFDSAAPRPGLKDRRTIVSVAFPREVFQQLARNAELHGMKVSEFIRSAATSAAGLDGATADIVVTGVGGQILLVEAKVAPTTRLSTDVIEIPISESEYTSSVA